MAGRGEVYKCKTQKIGHFFGTVHWKGLLNDHPAVGVSWFGGAALWVCVKGNWYVWHKTDCWATLADWIEAHE